MPHAIAVLLFLIGPPGEEGVGTGPAPSLRPIAWELEFKFLDPRRITVQVPGQEQPEVYWYMVYTVSNPDRRSVRFFPTFQLVTEDVRVVDTDVGVSKLVFDTIKERYRQTHKYLTHPTEALGELLTGDDNARESVAIWRDVDLSGNRFSVYVAGLSGETQFVRNPAYDPNQPDTAEPGPDGKPRGQNPKYFALRKTLQIRYNLPGSAAARAVAEPERSEVRWIMR